VFGVNGGPLYVNAADHNSSLLADYYSPSASAPTCPQGAGGPVGLPSLSVIAGTGLFSVSSTTATKCVAGPHSAVESFIGDYTGSAVINGTGGIGTDAQGYGGVAANLVATDGVPFCPTVAYCPQAGFGNQYEVFPARGTGADGGSLAGFHDVLNGQFVNTTLVNTNLVSTAYNDFAALEINAVSDGKVYWQFLRSQNITNPLNVPAKYILITPAQLLSDGVCIDNVSIYAGTHYKGPCANLNYNESYSLYLAWLYDLNVFNATTYRQAQPVSCGSAGVCTFWGNINLFGYGDVYIPGAPAQNSTGYPGGEIFGNPASWAMINTQLLFFPQLLDPDVFKVYNKTWELPQAAPLAVYGTADGLFKPLTGNGTVNGIAVNGSGPGAAIYLKYCDLYTKNVSAASGLCTAYPYTVNYTIGVLVCGSNTQSCFVTPNFPAGSACYDIFALNGYLGFAGALSCALAWLVDIVIVIVIIAVAVAIAGLIFGKKPRGMRA